VQFASSIRRRLRDKPNPHQLPEREGVSRLRSRGQIVRRPCLATKWPLPTKDMHPFSSNLLPEAVSINSYSYDYPPIQRQLQPLKYLFDFCFAACHFIATIIMTCNHCLLLLLTAGNSTIQVVVFPFGAIHGRIKTRPRSGYYYDAGITTIRHCRAECMSGGTLSTQCCSLQCLLTHHEWCHG